MFETKKTLFYFLILSESRVAADDSSTAHSKKVKRMLDGGFKGDDAYCIIVEIYIYIYNKPNA